MDRARACLEEIGDLYQSGPDANGAELLGRVADLFFVTAEEQTPQDREAFGSLMEQMAFASDPVTRAIFSERIATADAAPVNLIRRLAQDEIFIARPVLQYSQSLREGDLVSIMRKAEQVHLRATAHRNYLTTPVTDIIVKRGDLDVLQTVVSNTGAEFSTEGLALLSKAADIHTDLQQMLSLRRKTAPRAITRLKQFGKVDFWQQMAETMLMTSEENDKNKAPKKKPSSAASKKKPAQAKETLSAKPPPNGKIRAVDPVSESVLIDRARSGEIEGTIEAFASITNLDATMVEHCLVQAHVSALMVLCKAHGFAPGTFTALLHARETATGEPTDDTIGLMRKYENMTSETAKRIINFSEKRPATGNQEGA